MIVELFLALCIVTLLFIWTQKALSKLNRLPPGPIRWPIVGSLPQILMIDSVYPHIQMTELSKKYGPIISIGHGVNYAVIVNSFDIMKELFKHPDTCQQRFYSVSSLQLTQGENIGMTWSRGNIWKQMRRFTVKGLRDFGFGKARLVEETYKEEVDTFLEDIANEIVNTGGIWKIDSIRIAIVTLNVIWSSIGGYRFHQTNQVIQDNIKINTDIFTALSPSALLGALPFLKFFPDASGYKRDGEFQNQIRTFFQEVIKEAKNKKNPNAQPATFIEMFLEEIEKNKTDPTSNMTSKQLVTVLMDLFLGANDTTSELTNWLILYLTLHQNVQNKAREELRLVSQNWTTSIPVAESSRLPYLQACIQETMRHSPFVTFAVPRLVSADIECAGYKIPKGTSLNYNFYSVFHDKDFWGDSVEEFIPERFLNSTEDKLLPSQMSRMIQFGFGSRKCPAQSLAIQSVSATIVGMLSTFKIGIVPDQEAKLQPGACGIVVSPKSYVVKLEPIPR